MTVTMCARRFCCTGSCRSFRRRQIEKPIGCDFNAYKDRNRIERVFNRLKLVPTYRQFSWPLVAGLSQTDPGAPAVLVDELDALVRALTARPQRFKSDRILRLTRKGRLVRLRVTGNPIKCELSEGFSTRVTQSRLRTSSQSIVICSSTCKPALAAA
jgi:hypothetical protein